LGKIPDSQYYEVGKPWNYYTNIVGVYILSFTVMIYFLFFFVLVFIDYYKFKNIWFLVELAFDRIKKKNYVAKEQPRTVIAEETKQPIENEIRLEEALWRSLNEGGE